MLPLADGRHVVVLYILVGAAASDFLAADGVAAPAFVCTSIYFYSSISKGAAVS